MIAFIKKLFSPAVKVDYLELYRSGAHIVDVRTKSEYKTGHVRNSINIPLQELSKNLGKLKKDKVVITCCASGMRSASARSILKSNGFKEVYNAGSWQSLKNKLK